MLDVIEKFCKEQGHTSEEIQEEAQALKFALNELKMTPVVPLLQFE